jgi:hypothetical protein
MHTKEINKTLEKFIPDHTIRDKASKAIFSTWKGGTMARLELFMIEFNKVRGTRYKANPTLLKNFDFWLKTYQPSEIMQAINNCDEGFWMDNDLSPTKLFRTRNTNGECDNIGDLLNYKKKKLV